MRRFIIHIFCLLIAIGASAAAIDEAKQLYNEGRYEEALESLRTLRKKTPKDGNVNYWLGATLVAMNRSSEAMEYLQVAEGRGVADASLALARIEIQQYDPESARTHFEKYQAVQRRNKRTVPESVETEISRAVLMENMLSRVEKITVIDSLEVDADAFFKHYKLSPEAGRLVSGATLHVPSIDLAYIPQNNTEMMYAQTDSAGVYELMCADILDDGNVSNSHAINGDELSGGGNARYPFMLSDGLTLYYANDGEGSLGGYDIFMTRRGEDGFLQPLNLGMPYNSPFDDYLLAIDETTGAGWWATNRNQIPGKVTIYIYIPSDNRVNVDSDDENLIALAKLSDISLTRTAGADYSDVLTRIDKVGERSAADAPTATANSFELAIGATGKVYTSLSDFKVAAARQAMTKALNARANVANYESELSQLRQEWGNGNKSVGSKILHLEDQLSDARSDYKRYTNQAITLETKK